MSQKKEKRRKPLFPAIRHRQAQSEKGYRKEKKRHSPSLTSGYVPIERKILVPVGCLGYAEGEKESKRIAGPPSPDPYHVARLMNWKKKKGRRLIYPYQLTPIKYIEKKKEKRDDPPHSNRTPSYDETCKKRGHCYESFSDPRRKRKGGGKEKAIVLRVRQEGGRGGALQDSTTWLPD